MKYAPRKVFVLEDGEYIEINYAQLCQEKARYVGRRFLPFHGMLMEASEDVYKEFYKKKRRQKYLNECSKNNGDFSYDTLTTDDFNGEDILVDTISDTAGQAETNVWLDKLRKVIILLSADEQRLLHHLFDQQLSERTIADMYGVSQVAIHKQKARTLAKLKNF